MLCPILVSGMQSWWLVLQQPFWPMRHCSKDDRAGRCLFNKHVKNYMSSLALNVLQILTHFVLFNHTRSAVLRSTCSGPKVTQQAAEKRTRARKANEQFIPHWLSIHHTPPIPPLFFFSLAPAHLQMWNLSLFYTWVHFKLLLPDLCLIPLSVAFPPRSGTHFKAHGEKLNDPDGNDALTVDVSTAKVLC